MEQSHRIFWIVLALGPRLSFGHDPGGLMDSFVNVKTVLQFMDSSHPIARFGRAALQGLSNQANSDDCAEAYPDCQKGPGILAKYLINHKDDLFKLLKDLATYKVTPPADAQSRILNTDTRSQSFPYVPPTEPQDYLPPSAHSSGDRFVFPDSSTRGGKQLIFPYKGDSSYDDGDFFPERPSYNPGSGYKPDFYPQNPINFKDKKSVKFPASMNFPL